MSQPITLVHLLIPLVVLGSGCSTRTGTMPGGESVPVVRDIDATFVLGERVSATARVSSFQFLWMTFTSGDVGKFGATSGGLDYVSEPFSLGDLLFGPPVSQQQAASAAYFDATALQHCDALVQTRVKTERSGFSLLGLIGWGECAATIEGYEARIVKDPAKPGQVSPAQEASPTHVPK